MITLTQESLKQFGNLELLAKQAVEGFIIGLHKSPYHGFSVEFAEHRLYNSGDAIRGIDWKVYARTDKMYVKRFEEETNLRCQIVVDSSSSMYFPKDPAAGQNTKIGFAVLCAASIMHLLRKQRDAVGLSLFHEEVYEQTRARSTSVHHRLLLNYLQRLVEEPVEGRQTAAATCLHQIAESIHKRSLVIIFSDMLDNLSEKDDLFSALQHLRHRNHEVILFHIYDGQREFDFQFENRPYEFIDLESGRRLKLRPAEVREYYTEKVRQAREELMLRCGQYRIDLVEADINRNFDEVLLAYLVKRSKLF